MTNQPKFQLTPNKKFYLFSVLIALILTLLTSFNVTNTVQNLAQALLESTTDEALIELLTPLQYINFHVSILPTVIGTLIVSLPVYRIFKTRRITSYIGWGILTLLLLGILWIISLFTLRIELVSTVKIILTLLKTLLRLI